MAVCSVIILLPLNPTHRETTAAPCGNLISARLHCDITPVDGCSPQSGIYPVADLHIYLQVWPCIPGALFQKENGLLVHYHELLSLMDKVAKFLDLSTDRFKPYSLCIGATTDLHLKSDTPEVIKKRGRWSSAAFQRYICV